MIKLSIILSRLLASKRIRINRRIRDEFYKRANFESPDLSHLDFKIKCIELIYGVDSVIVTDKLIDNYCEVHFITGHTLTSDFVFFNQDTISKVFFKEVFNFSNRLIIIEMENELKKIL